MWMVADVDIEIFDKMMWYVVLDKENALRELFQLSTLCKMQNIMQQMQQAHSKNYLEWNVGRIYI